MFRLPVRALAHHPEKMPFPTYSTKGSAGMDLRAAIAKPLVLKRFERMLIPSGIAMALPDGIEGQIRPRSGLAYKHGITVPNTPATIDSDYRGELLILLMNLGEADFVIDPGMRIAQIVFARYEKATLESVVTLDDTERAESGFGSTGVR